MATSCSYMVSTRLSMLGWSGGGRKELRNRRASFISAQQQQTDVEEAESVKAPPQEEQEQEQAESSRSWKPKGTKPRPVEPQLNVKSKNMTREYGGQWLSCTTRHIRIFAAYIDPVTCEFDQTQMDKLTLILDPSNEFVWKPDTCNLVYSYFQELVDHYEGAPLTEYTLRLIGSDLEHYIRKLLYDGVIKYNMDAKVLNFSMGKPRIMFNNDNQLEEPPEK
ncbi:NAD(P)H-quinone oxidoreductase subunit M, chloroplastic [Arachis stenosperma]|uniref:NAD(P)H-quinone oxidoreductase subunit M, chloroplastic n=1 Tax=Arachis stenosperma TaxID=217475 RepID=UPI0025ACFF54|nr:NAD(P)H-quinone oxidoreductase subunit M, chloroplastic [Arachis stenosperma]